SPPQPRCSRCGGGSLGGARRCSPASTTRRRYGSAGRTPCHIRLTAWPGDGLPRRSGVLEFDAPSPRGEGGARGRRALPGPLSSGCGRSRKRRSRGGPETAQAKAAQGGAGGARGGQAPPAPLPENEPARMAKVAFRFLNRAEVQALLPPTLTLLEVVEAGLRAHGAGEVVLPPKSHIHLDDRFNGHFNVLP